MIDVPYEVKKALKDGRNTKNYRLIVESQGRPSGYYEIATAPENQQLIIPADGGYKIFANAPNAYDGITTWDGDEPLEWLTPTTTTPTTEYTGYFSEGDVISVAGYNGINTVSLQQWVDDTYQEEIVIDNNNLVKESVHIDERMCSGDTLKFGLCEGSSLEFQYFNKPNITGRRIQAFVDIQYLAGTVGRIDANGSFTAPVSGSYTFEVKKGSATGLYITFAGGGDMYVDFVLGQTTDTEELEAGDVVTLNNPSSDALFEASTEMWDTIPMGFFDVKKCSRQASTGIIKATCYNKLQSDYLDSKANELLISSFDNPEQTALFKDIRNILLNDYEVMEDDGVPVTIDRADAGVGTVHRMGSSTIRFRNGDVDAPTNYETYTGAMSLSKNVYPFLVASESKANLNPDYVYKIRFKYDIEKLEQRYYDELKRLTIASFEVDESFMKRFVNPSTWSGYVPYLGWHTYFGVGIEKSNGQMEYYSSIAYANQLTNVVGSLSDLSKKTIIGCVAVYFYIPYEFLVNSQNDFRGYTGGVRFYGQNNYKYQGRTKQYMWYSPDGILTDYDWTIDGWNDVFKYDYSDADKVEISPSSLEDFTLREIITASYETVCQFGQLSRVTDLFSGVTLNRNALYPADDLHPANDLYPRGASLSTTKALYSKLWADEDNVHKWRYLIITYKGLDGQGNETEYTLQRTINSDGTDDYNMSDNWLFRNLVWTASQVGEYADAMVTKMQDITWFPFEMWCAGLPYLETGDEIEITLGEETYTSYILQRQLKGIQNLQDTYINGTLDIF